MASVSVLILLLLATVQDQAAASIGQLLGPQSTAARHRQPHHISCESWRLGVETNNVRDWLLTPADCQSYVRHYILGHHYRQDSRVVVDEAIKYVKQLNLTVTSETPAWVFDVDETSLCNVPFVAQHEFWAKPVNETSIVQWYESLEALALPESLRLYNKLLTLGVKVVFLTGRVEAMRKATANNLKKAGYHTWETLLLRGTSDAPGAMEYKSSKRTKLVANGYRIIGNIGDQWSDILGANQGDRTFKLPNPMYYVP